MNTVSPLLCWVWYETRLKKRKTMKQIGATIKVCCAYCSWECHFKAASVQLLFVLESTRECMDLYIARICSWFSVKKKFIRYSLDYLAETSAQFHKWEIIKGFSKWSNLQSIGYFTSTVRENYLLQSVSMAKGIIWPVGL